MSEDEGNDDVSSNGHWLNENSEEFQGLKSYLQLCLKSQALATLEIWKIENEQMLSKFEKKYAKMTKMQCWFDINKYCKSDNAVQDMCSKGFFGFPFPGFQFFNGVIEDNFEGNGLFVLCDVAIGRSYVVDHDPSRHPVPEGYDSFYLVSSPLDKNNDGEFSIHEYQAAATFEGRNCMYV